MFIGDTGDACRLDVGDFRRAGFRRQSFQPGIHDRAFGNRAADHGRIDEERLLETGDGRPRRIQVLRVVRVHEDVRARLQLVVDTACRFKFPCAGACARHDVARDTLPAEQVDGRAGQVDGGVGGRAPLGVAADVLREAVVGLDTRKPEPIGCGDLPCQRQRLIARRHAAARHPDVDLHQYVDADAGADGRCADLCHVMRIVHADPDLCLAGHGCQPGNLPAADNLVAHENIGYPGLHQRLRFAHLLAARPHGPQRHLPSHDRRALVGFRMRAELDTRGCDAAGHGVEIALESVHLDEEGRRVDVGERHAGLGGRGRGHGGTWRGGWRRECAARPRLAQRLPPCPAGRGRRGA